MSTDNDDDFIRGPRWEYRVEDTPISIEHLSALGDERWENYAVVPVGSPADDKRRLYFKRRKK